MNMLLSADAYVSPSTLLSSYHTTRKRWFPVGVQGIVVNFGVDSSELMRRMEEGGRTGEEIG